MLIVGLTGSIGMGKSTAAAQFAARGIPVFSADDAVHELYQGELVPQIAEAFPGCVVEGVVDRGELAQVLAEDPQALARLEALVHPAVQKREWRFLEQARNAGATMAVLEIPLLFEVGADRLVDASIVLTAPPEVQRARVLARPGMSEAKFSQLLARQMSDAEKRARADYVIDSSGPIAATADKIAEIIDQLSSHPAKAFARWQEIYQ